MAKAARRQLDEVGARRRGAGDAGAESSAGRMPAPRGRAARETTWLPPVVIALVASVLYANSLSVPFLLDDPFEITRNGSVTKLDPLWAYFARPRGISMLSFALNYAWGQTDVAGYHLVNLVVHVVNGLLLYALIVSTLRLPYFDHRYDAHARTLSLIIALVFIAHPLQTMAVTYIVQRAESLASCFYLLSLLLFVHGATRRRGWQQTLAYGGAVGAGLLGVLTKQTVATLPITVILYRFCFLRRAADRAAAQRWTVLAILVVTASVTLTTSWSYLVPIEGEKATLFPASAGFGVVGITPVQYLTTQFGVIVWYLRLLFVPTQLCFDYGWPLADGFWRADVVLPMLVLAALVAVAIGAFRHYRLATFCIGWFFTVLIPSSSFVPLRDIAFEHRMYLPLAGLTWLLVVAAYDAAAWLAPRVGIALQTLRRLLAGAAALWIGVLAALTIARNELMRDPIRLAADSAAKAPHHWRNHFEHGSRLLEGERLDEAMAALQQAVRIDPRQGPPHLYLADIHMRRGDLHAAEVEISAVLDAPEPSVVAAGHRQLGLLNEARHQFDRARLHYAMAVQLMPAWVNTRKRLAWIYEKQGDWLLAAEQYEAALQSARADDADLHTRAALAYYRVGVRELGAGHDESAIAALEASARHRDTVASVSHYLALAYARRGQWERADAAIATAARLDPNAAAITANVERIRRRELPSFARHDRVAPP